MMPKHTGTWFVAAAVVALALPAGGYSLELQAAITIGVWIAVIAALASGAFPRAPMPREACWAGALLLALALLTGISMAWASDDGAAYAETVRAFGYLGCFALVVCASRRASARYWLMGLAIGVVAVAALAAGSRLVPFLPGDDREIAALLPAANGRLSYPIDYWNGLGALLALGGVLVAWLGGNAGKQMQRALAAAALPLLGLTLYLTSSRGAIAALAIGLVTLMALDRARLRVLATLAIGGAATLVPVLLASRRPELLDGVNSSTAESQGAVVLVATLAAMAVAGVAAWSLDARVSRLRLSPSRRALRGAAAAGVVVVAIAAVAANPGQRWDEFRDIPEAAPAGENGFVAQHFSSGSGNGRYQFWGEAVDAVEEEPVRGIGAGGYRAYWSEHAPIDQRAKNAHSLYLETLAELGPLGLLLVLAFFGIGLASGVAAWRSERLPESVAGLAMLVTGAVSAGIDFTWEIPAVFAPVVVSVALLTGPALPRDAGRDGRTVGYGWAFATIAVGWIAFLLAGDAFLAERNITQSRDAAGRGDYEEALDGAAGAVALQPWAAEPRLQLALVKEADGSPQEAVEAVAEATERAPDDWRMWLARARIEVRAGDVQGGLRSLARARELNPRSPVFAEGATPASP